MTEYWYHGMIRKYVIVFGTLFNEINIERTNEDGTIDHTFKVPISYGPKEKFLARLEANPEDIERNVSIKLPRIGFEMIDLQYSGIRTMNRLNELVFLQNSNDGRSSFKTIWQPVPYDLIFEMTIIGKNMEDVLKIVEQIVPRFQPEWNVTAKLLEDFPDYTLDIPIELMTITPIDTYSGDFQQRRAIMYTMTFGMKGWFFSKVEDKKIIKVAKVNIYDDITNPKEAEQVKVYPGQTANGEATTSNTNTIHWSNIEEDEDWGYIVEIEPYTDWDN